MVRHASLFSQMVALFDRGKFHSLVFRHKAERYCKGFDSWDHFVAMLFCQLAQAKSLREICGGLSCCLGKLRHLGVKKAPNKSTLSYANAHRPWQMYQELFYQTLECLQIGRYRQASIQIQKQAALPGQLDHIAVLIAFPMGQIPANQRGRKTAPAVGS